MRKISLFLQEVLKVLIWFLLYYVWLRYFIRKFWLSLLLAIAFAVATYLLLSFFKRKKNAKVGLRLKEKTEAENMFLSLACHDKPMDFFEKLAKLQHENVAKHKSYITITYPQEKAKTLLYFESSFDGLNIAKTIEIYNKIKKEKATKIVICCKFIADKGLQNFLSSFDEKFLLLDEYETYEKLYKLYDCYPQITKKYNTQKSAAFKDMIAYSFNKKRTKGYLISAVLLVLSSLFVRMTIYYCVIASLLVIFALISQFNPYFNNKTQTQIL